MTSIIFFLFNDFFDVRRQNKNLTMCLYLGNVETLLIEDEQYILSCFQNSTFVCWNQLWNCFEIWKKKNFCKNEEIFAKLQFQSEAHEGRKCVINDRSLWLYIRLKSLITSPLLTSLLRSFITQFLLPNFFVHFIFYLLSLGITKMSHPYFAIQFIKISRFYGHENV